jgi:hypothetical protein
MTRRRNKTRSLQKHRHRPIETSDKTDQKPVEPEIILPVSDAARLINARIIQVLVERDSPEEVERLLKLDLDYNEKRLAIIRNHEDQDPNSMEERHNSRFRRFQYKCLLLLLPFILVGAMFAPLLVSAGFLSLCILIVCGVLLNGRERELDLTGFVKLLTAIVKREE